MTQIAWNYKTTTSEVYIAGDFTNWENVLMTPVLDQTQNVTAYVYNTNLSPGTYQYKFYVDNDWVHDGASLSILNPFNSYNNYITV